MTVLIQESDTRDRISVEALENRMEAKLKSLGIDTKEQLFLSDLDSDFKSYLLRKKGVLKSKRYTLLVYDASMAGKVIQGLESIGIANINLQKVEVSYLEELKMELRKKAVGLAKRQAETMLQPLGQNLGKAIYISDLSTGIMRDYREDAVTYAVRGIASTESPINVDFRKIQVNSSVNVKFAIE